MTTQDCYFAITETLDDGREVVPHIHGTLAEALEIHSLSTSRSKLRRRDFVPLESPVRFRIVTDQWTKPRKGIGGSRSVACPTSPLDWPQPDGEGIGMEFYHDEIELLDRAAGLAEVSRRNRLTMESCEKAKDLYGKDWCVLVELGERSTMPASVVQIKPNGMGCETRHFDFPVRLVKPTLEEIDKFE